MLYTLKLFGFSTYLILRLFLKRVMHTKFDIHGEYKCTTCVH